MPPRKGDKQGSAIKATLTRQEFKRLDALFQLKALTEEVRQAERLQEKFALDARKAGATWGEIGAALGITQQSANQRYSSGNAKRVDRPSYARKPSLPVKQEVQQSLLV